MYRVYSYDEPKFGQKIFLRSLRFCSYSEHESHRFEQYMLPSSYSGSFPYPPDVLQAVGPAYTICDEEDLPTFQAVCLNSSQCPSENKIYTMFHGKTYAAAKKIIKHGFKPSKDDMLGRGVYVRRDMTKAMKYPIHYDLRKVELQVIVNVGKVIKIDCQNHPLQKTWHDHGYNTAWVPPHCGMNPSGQEEDCVYNPKRIKVVDIVHGDDEDVRKLRHLFHIL